MYAVALLFLPAILFLCIQPTVVTFGKAVQTTRPRLKGHGERSRHDYSVVCINYEQEKRLLDKVANIQTSVEEGAESRIKRN